MMSRESVGDREDLLQDRSRKETSKRIKPFAANSLIKSVIKGLRDKKGNIKMLLQELKKRTSSINMFM